MPVSKGDTVRIQEHSGEFLATVLNTDKHEGPNGDQLYRIKVTEIIAQPNYDLEEGETINVYPAEAKPA